MKELNIIGMGYIGLPTALMFAAHGQKIIGTDLKVELIDKLRDGILSYSEDGMGELFDKSRKDNNIEFTTKYIKTNKYLIAVPTPYLKKSKKIDATYLKEAIKKVIDICEQETIIIIESTIAPGTIENEIKPIISEHVKDKIIHLVHVPERTIPGNMIYELENNSRIIGADDYNIGIQVKELYSCFCNGEICVTNIKTAELCKVIENSFRDVNIAFANELAKICNRENLNVNEVIQIANKHPRVNIMKPGPGVGGHCISVDPWFLVGEYGDLTRLILSAREVNNSMPLFVLNKLKDIMKENKITTFNRVGIYGLTYKENVNDVRESPTLQLLDLLKKNNINGIKIYDPYIDTDLVDNQYHNYEKFVDNVDVVLVMVGHDEIKEKQEYLNEKIIYDTRNVMKRGKRIYKL